MHWNDEKPRKMEEELAERGGSNPMHFMLVATEHTNKRMSAFGDTLKTRETGTQRTLAASTEQMLVVISIEIDECCIYNDEFCI